METDINGVGIGIEQHRCDVALIYDVASSYLRTDRNLT